MEGGPKRRLSFRLVEMREEVLVILTVEAKGTSAETKAHGQARRSSA